MRGKAMKTFFKSKLFLPIVAATFLCACNNAEPEVDNSNLFIYCPSETEGLHLAVKESQGDWKHLGQLCGSDYGAWGIEKKMYRPYVLRASDSTWRAVWTVNGQAPTFAAAYSKNLVTWRPQEYPLMEVSPCNDLTMAERDGNFYIYYNDGKAEAEASFDFRQFEIVPADEKQPLDNRIIETVEGNNFSGQKFTVGDSLIIFLKNYFDNLAAENAKNSERMYNDSTDLLPNLKLIDGKAQLKIKVDFSGEKRISSKLLGVFFEDISYAADGGLYAELIQNRDFEYSEADNKEFNSTTAWKSDKNIEISNQEGISKNNPNYAIIENQTLTNSGFGGIAVKKGAKYNFSIFAKNVDSKNQVFTVALINPQDGKTLSSTKINVLKSTWTKYTATMFCTAACDNAELSITPQKDGKTAVDMISLFPQDTYKNRKNGLRKDLAEAIAALHPKFVRFPGGCMTHGQGIDNIYHWQHSIGNLEDRNPDMNIWNYHQTRGLGFYEFFQWCEDMGAEPLPVLAAGVPCQNSLENANHYGGQQGGIPMDDIPAYTQEILDLIEWANGDVKTSALARQRAAAGHAKPFNLKYIGIGNEDIVSTVFEERYELIATAVKAKYPDITICGTAGPFHYPSADYIEGWDFAVKNADIHDLVDEHYYESTGWFLNHTDYYDNYNRKNPKVYLGEYSAYSTEPRQSNIETALTEALYLCNVERNADVVEMTSYAPLLCKQTNKNWDPDMIYFTNTEVFLTPSYQTQRIFGTYSGTSYVPTEITADDNVKHRVAVSVVKDAKNKKTYLRIVNALPVAAKIDISGLSFGKQTDVESFSGYPKQTNAIVTKNKITVKDNSLEIPPYTFINYSL